MVRNKTLVSFGIAALLVAFGCGGGSEETRPDYMPPPGDGEGSGGGGDGEPVHATGGSSATATIGAAGGSLAVSNGWRLEIPAGALGDTVTIALSAGSQTQAWNNRDYERPIGPAMQIQPALVAQPGQRLTVSAPLQPLPSGFTQENITLAYEVVDEHQRELGGRGTNTQTRWDYANATVSGERMSAEVPGLGGFRLQFLVSADEDVAP